jgi:hypothetical protein
MQEQSIMNPSIAIASQGDVESNGAFELRFGHLFQEGRGLAFPCDAGGRVKIDELSEKARQNYFFARALVGREYAMPAVARRDVH